MILCGRLPSRDRHAKMITSRTGSANCAPRRKPVGLVVDDAGGVGVGEFGRELEGGRVHAGEVLWPAARGPQGERGFLLVPGTAGSAAPWTRLSWGTGSTGYARSRGQSDWLSTGRKQSKSLMLSVRRRRG